MLNRRNLMLRAHQLRRWNAGDDRGFGHWLRRAWAEWKVDGGARWDFSPPRPRTIAQQIAEFETVDRLGMSGLRRLHQMRADLNAERRAAA